MSPSIPSELQAVLDKAMAALAPGSRLTVQKDLVGGHSTASVLLVDIAPPTPAPGSPTVSPSLSGEFILKLDQPRVWEKPEATERERHEAARDLSPSFGEEHIPRLRHFAEHEGATALVYEIAGRSLVSLVTADSLDAGALERRCSQVAVALLSEWNKDYRHEQLSARQVLEAWLGYRLDSAKAPKLHEFVAAETGGRGVLVVAGRLLPNPLSLCSAPCVVGDAPHMRPAGLLHGDLHPGNLLLDRHDQLSERFWLIDFALSHRGPLGYDHAYFEIGLLLHYLGGLDPERMLGILEALDAQEDLPQASMVPVQDMGLVRCLRSMRLATDQWQRVVEPDRRDPFWAQQLLARIAVSLNWANKPLDDSRRRLALAYGAWAASRYIQTFHPSIWPELAAEANQAVLPPPPITTPPPTERSAWSEVWEEADRFDETSSKFILIAGRLEAAPELASLGLLPWSAVIDLDPLSDEDGLRSCVSPVLDRMRSVKQFGRQALPVDADRGTAWFMGGGWPSRHEPIPDSLREWRRVYLPCLRELCGSLRRAIAPQPVKVVALTSEGVSGERLARVLEAVDEAFGDMCHVLVLGPHPPSDEVEGTRRFDLSSQAFVAGVRSMYGAKDELVDPQVPGAAGPVAIPIDHLRNLEEDLDILHTRVLTENAVRSNAHDDFWRGNPPTWADLHAGADIPRLVQPPLMGVLEDSLRQSRNHTIELHHSPGAGGTTVSLRAAWALRESYPTAILRRASNLTVDRIDQLFQLTQRPVLLVAEASILPASARELLYRDLASRNARVVILYVIRTRHQERDRPLSVFDPMERDEATAFYRRYSERTENLQRRHRLQQISTDPVWERYRSPFFYGLLTYEREFQSVERYVEAHLQGIGYRPRKVMLYLALVTRYSQIGVDEALLLSLLGLRPDTRLDLDEAIGEGSARLTVRQRRQRKLLHPLIAEEVLRELLGGHEGEAWKDGLKDLAIDFINDVARILGSDADETDRLFTQLFILRDVWYERQSKGRPRFSELIQAMPSAAGQHQVLQLLTEVCPHEAHYWNHLGRHHFYEMKQDFAEAERYLEKAVELSPDDSYHHHSLGMVRRFWTEDRLADLFRKSPTPSGEQALDEVGELVIRAAGDFERTRKLNPEDEHGYVTHAQMILHVAERLIRASGDEGLIAATSAPGAVGQWLRSNLVLAEDLLARLQHLRGQGQPSRYELTCVSRLSGLYGDFEHVIGIWEGMLDEAAGQGDLRRALASAYYARGSRMWSSLPEGELRRIVDLMDTNLREDPTNDRDVRMWFQAYRRLPEFSYLHALDRLESWATRAGSLDAYFYLYVLHYLRLQEGTARGEELVLANLEKCRELARGRRGHSYEWLGLRPSWCPLVHHSELGEWDRAIGFYPDGGLLLAPVTGTIETVKGPQAGTLRLGRAIRAFFVPGTRQWGSKDINTLVHFYLGFSYDGFRAWSVEPGPLSQGESTKRASSRSKDAEGRKPVTAAPGGHSNAPAPAALGRAQREVLGKRLTAFVVDLLTSAENTGRDLLVPTLGSRIAKEFPGESIITRLGHPNLTAYVLSEPELEIEGAPPRSVVRLASTARGPLASSPLPGAIPARPATKARATAKRRVHRGADDPVLYEQVRQCVLKELAGAEGSGRTLLVSRLGKSLRQVFAGTPVYQRLGFERLIDLLRTVEGVAIGGETTREFVERAPPKH